MAGKYRVRFGDGPNRVRHVVDVPMIHTSDTVADLFAALAKAQADMPSALKDTTGQVGNAVRKYADLPSVREAARGPLTEHGLAFVQFPAGAPGGYVRVITRIIHRSGEWIEDDDGITMPTGNNTAQAVGSAMTYARRYALMAALGIVADDDDDGHAATTTGRGRPRTPPPPSDDNPNAITPAQLKKLAITFGDVGITDRDERLRVAAGVIGRPLTTSKELTKAEAGMVIDALEAHGRKQP